MRPVHTMSIDDISKFAPISLIHHVSIGNPDLALFKLPTSINGVWEDITYAQFFADIERVAFHTLCYKPWPKESVIGIWSSGISYSDVVHIFAIMRAGCIPHLLNVELSRTSNDVILDLLKQSNACALFLDPSLLGNDFSEFEFCEKFTIKDVSEYPAEINRDLLPPIPTVAVPEQLVLLLQTSGSTGGRCKLVRYDFRIYTALVKKRKHVMDMSRGDAPLTTPRVGSFCHCAQITELFVVVAFAGTVILLQPNFNSSKLLQMYQECRLTAFGQFTAFIELHLKNSRQDRFLLNVLKSMDEILVMGSPLPEDELEWARKNKIPLMNAYGLTECGGLLVGWKENPAHLVPVGLDGLHYDFRLIPHTSRDIDRSLNNDKPRTLKELVVLSNSFDCPHPTLRSKVDGHFYTGDIFEEAGRGCYFYKGRLDDLIKMENGRICDTASIENRIRKNCSDIIHACVVVGTHRPSPTLLVEPKEADYNKEWFISTIDLQLSIYNANVYEHERLSRDHIIIVPKGSLPRTLKGNIRRKVAEQTFSQRLDELYGPIQTI